MQAEATHLPANARILVIGTSSAGKTTLAAALARRLGIPAIELDALYWSPGWQAKPTDEFLRLLRDATAGPSWVADGNYSVARPVLWPRVNVIVWLNYALPVVFWRGLVRAVRRAWRGEVLWHGNRESFFRTFFSRDSILLWILTTHRRRNMQFRQLQGDPQYAGILWIELRKPSQASAWLGRVRQAVGPGQLPAGASDPSALT